MTQPLRSAAITTFFPDSHAGVLVPKFIRSFTTDDGLKAAVPILGDNGYCKNSPMPKSTASIYPP